ncbi:MAG: hypothetical protein DI528_02150 [Shinella sp.]|nr:MAG: hypothetical protein DI528_02150 [Shinella sp.]
MLALADRPTATTGRIVVFVQGKKACEECSMRKSAIKLGLRWLVILVCLVFWGGVLLLLLR